MGVVSLGERIRSATDETVRRGPHCPDELRVAGFVEDGLEQADRIRLQSHLADCDYCLHLVGFLSRMAAAGLPASVPADLEVAARETRFSATPASGSRVAWRWASAAMILAFTSVAVWKLGPETGRRTDSHVRGPAMPGSPPTLAPEPGGRGPQILFPDAGTTMPAGGVTFQWTQVPTAVSYSVRIVTLDGDIVWEKRAFTMEVQVPPMVELLPGETYLVRVSAHLPGGKTLDSEHVRFLARRP